MLTYPNAIPIIPDVRIAIAKKKFIEKSPSLNKINKIISYYNKYII